jgi:hypothetical protein
MKEYRGCIGLVRGHTWLSKAIRYYMNVYRKRKGLSPMPLYNHAFLFVEIMGGEMYAVEALWNGIIAHPLKKAYPKKKWNKIKVKVPKRSFSKTEIDIIEQTAIHYAFKRTKYQFSNFLSQIIWTWLGVWIGTGKTDQRFYCTEFAAYCVNKTRQFFKHPERVNPLDIDINSYFKDKYLE